VFPSKTQSQLAPAAITFENITGAESKGDRIAVEKSHDKRIAVW
jgi:hypothetical protein